MQTKPSRLHLSLLCPFGILELLPASYKIIEFCNKVVMNVKVIVIDCDILLSKLVIKKIDKIQLIFSFDFIT